MSTVGKGALNNLLVEDVETGKQCIAFLKKNNLGTANFLALDKTKHFQVRNGGEKHIRENVHERKSRVRRNSNTSFFQTYISNSSILIKWCLLMWKGTEHMLEIQIF